MSSHLTKKVNPLLILLGFVFILILQTWVSVLNAEQAYLMSEARSDEAKINRVLTRMGELNNNLSSPEYVYAQAHDSNMRIILNPNSSNLPSEDWETWEGSSNTKDLESSEKEAADFLQIYRELLPKENKQYFSPIRENLKKTFLKHPLNFIEYSISQITNFRSNIGSNFSGEESQSVVDSDIAEEVDDKVNEELKNTITVDEINTTNHPQEDDTAVNFGGDLPAPVTR